MLILNILSDHFRCYFIANRMDKGTIILEFLSPKLFLYLREFLKHYLCGYTFDYLNHPRRSIFWRHKMHVIIHYFHRVYFKFVLFCDFAKYLFQSLRHSIEEQFFPLFWYPYEMILQIIDTMFASCQWVGS
jgi:hypothetical protein